MNIRSEIVAANATAVPHSKRTIPWVDLLPGLLVLLDATVIAAAAIASYVILVEPSAVVADFYVFAVGFILLVSILLFRRGGLYRTDALLSAGRCISTVLIAKVAAFAFLLTILHALKTSALFQGDWLIAFAISSFCGIALVRAIAGRVLKDLVRVGKIGRRTAVFGTGRALEQFLHRVALRKGQLMEVSAVYGPASPFGGPPVRGYPLAGGFQDLLQAARQEHFDDIVIAFPDSESAQATEAIETLRELPVDVYIAPQVTGLGRRMRPVYHEGDLPMFEVWQRPISGWDRFLKLALDYLIAGIALLLLLPALALIAVAIRADSRGPVLFRQTRLGFNNREFEIYKFRTMRQRDDAESDVLQATRHDPRVTRVGWFLRRTSLDELPQLLNVLNGTMSLVGPRPHALSHNADFSNVVRGYFGRHKVKPGITGWAQVNGLRGEIDCDEKLKARIAHDVHYAENWSIYLDLRILFTTAFVVLFQKNAY